MNECYLCGRKLENDIDNTTANHREHIIPQALGGQLTVDGILCKECGGEKYLGSQIDKPICSFFQIITERLDIKRDRKTRPVALAGKLRLLKSDHIIDVNLKDGVLTNRRPEYKINHDKKTITIYANKTVAKNYRKKAERDLIKNGRNSADYTIEIISDLSSHDQFLGVLELPFNLDNKIFEAGLAKIAIEFALYNGVELSSFSHLIDRSNRIIKSEHTLLPYYPIFKVEEIIEYLRTSIDNNFMSHSLVLFSQRQIQENGEEVKQLYCFIELFGTFQFFVRLNDNYIGANIEPVTYSQRIIKDSGKHVEMDGLPPKEVSIYMNEIGMSFDNITNKSYDEARKMIEHRYNSRNRYVFDYASNIKQIVDRILYDAMLKSNETITKIIPDIAYHFYWNPDTDDFHITFFRSRYHKHNHLYSIIPEIAELYQLDKEKFDKYTFFKFNELEAFVNENTK